ncbi:hypothetical protein MLD38_040290 [Melastoma candidum]|uniref:Uncharacterized protein n=1 Tax=Melastoma candidum TaxID=119954 RepID=A0ACB9L4R2_9MYRT|nr:hypothetical protein MLD38_040290 [Melastoma candidum]
MAYQQVQQGHQPTTAEEVRTLWIGDLQYWVDESYLYSCFSQTGELVSVKIIRNKITGQPEGYGFVEFVSHSAAERVLQTYNGTQMPGTEFTFRLNWASFGMGERRGEAGPEHSIFVGDLAPDVTDYMLQETFKNHYSSVRGAKVVTDPSTGRSKGYGFVKFSDENERNRAMNEMNGAYCSTRPMRISAATPKKTSMMPQQYAAVKSVYPVAAYAAPPAQVLPVANDANNTTIFVGNLDQNVTEDELRQIFSQFGEISNVKIPVGKGCGFVEFRARASSEEAIQRMQGVTIGQQAVRLSWGHNAANKQEVAGGWGQQVDPNQWSAYYGYGQGYDAYAYGATPDPSLYGYDAYGGYVHYPQQAEGVQDISGMAGGAHGGEQRGDSYDPLAPPDVDKLNAAYLSVHGRAIMCRPFWYKNSSVS